MEGIIGHSLPVIIVRQNVDGMEIEFANALVEDSNNDALGYTDCQCSGIGGMGWHELMVDLMAAHKSITNELSGNGSGGSWFGRS